uniref:winged helix-turn-helix transcriptional regulator n=1 Tax=Halomonas sp. TaxID=1486246 RepID=UPI0026398457|nr:helix-turn-helix domain-containing protein [Halomonas sp.]
MKDLVSRCPIEEVMQVLSGRWPTLLIYYLKEGTKRFADLRRDNPTISHKMLTMELRKLQEAGIVERTEFEGYPLRVEYDLTAAGHQLVPLIDALGQWWETTTGEDEESEPSSNIQKASNSTLDPHVT